MRDCYHFLLLLLAANVPVALHAQLDKQAQDPQLTNTISVFNSMVRDQSALYNGSYYYRFPEYIHSGHPFFVSDKPAIGEVFYDGTLFKNVPLLYDERIDELITYDYNKTNLLQLVKLKVNMFSIHGSHFINVTDTHKAIPSGYYQLLYSSRSQVLSKEVKKVKTRIISQVEVNRSAETENSRYARINGRYHMINGSKALMKLFGSHRNAVSDMMKGKKMKYKANPSSYIVEAVSYYDQLAERK